jgi:hypothetical protein
MCFTQQSPYTDASRSYAAPFWTSTTTTPLSAILTPGRTIRLQGSPRGGSPMTHVLRQNLLASSKRKSYSGKNGVSLKDGHWQLSAKLARLLGVSPGTPGTRFLVIFEGVFADSLCSEYAQVACRQAELEMQKLRQAAVEPDAVPGNLLRASSISANRRQSRASLNPASEANESDDDDSTESLTASRRSSLIRGLAAAMEQWRLNAGCQVGCLLSVRFRANESTDFMTSSIA